MRPNRFGSIHGKPLSLLKIINRIIDELIESDTEVTRAEKISHQKYSKRTKSAISDSGSVAKELMEGADASIGTLRNQLAEVVVDIAKRPTNPFKKIVIYVDDLDRIEPKNAVAILECVPNCVL